MEDEPASSAYLKEILDPSDYSAIFVDRGKDAINIVQNQKDIGLILLDIRLPDIDGYQVARRIKALNPSIPIIAQTAYATSEDKKKCMKEGFSDYIAKPIDADMLLTKINYIMSSK